MPIGTEQSRSVLGPENFREQPTVQARERRRAPNYTTRLQASAIHDHVSLCVPASSRLDEHPLSGEVVVGESAALRVDDDLGRKFGPSRYSRRRSSVPYQSHPHRWL